MNENHIILSIRDTDYVTMPSKKFLTRKRYVPKNDKIIKAILPCTVKSVFVNESQNVKKGDKLLIFESMKMDNELLAVSDGKVKKIYVETGIRVPKDTILIEFE